MAKHRRHSPERQKEGKDAKRHIVFAASLLVLVIATVLARYAEPVKDGDLWHQMAYGRYLLENNTFVPDHTVFTWGKADGSIIYCAWISEIFLFLLHQAGGLPGLFVFRYACIFLFAGAVFLYAAHRKIVWHPFTWPLCLIGILTAQTAIFLKPEIFSFVLLTAASAFWFYIKAREKPTRRLFYLFPLLVLVWVNTHGVFIFGCLFLAAMGMGELLNYLFRTRAAMDKASLGHLFTSLVLSAAAVFITPYGWRYPVYLLKKLLYSQTSEFQFVAEYTSIFDAQTDLNHFPLYLVIMGTVLLLLFFRQVRNGRTDFSVLVANILFGFLFTVSVRMTYYWAPVFCFSCLYMISLSPAPLLPRKKRTKTVYLTLLAAACLFLAAQSVYDVACRQFPRRWLGFGNSLQNPVACADFISKNLSGYSIGNDYSGGGYLLWKLAPETKILIDPRYLPFKDWIEQHLDFLAGRHTENHLKSLDCSVWCINYRYFDLIKWFLSSDKWKTAFYGPSSAVFVKESVPLPGPPGIKTADTISGIRNLAHAAKALRFAVEIADFETAGRIVGSLQSQVHCPSNRSFVKGADHYVKGMRHYKDRNYEKAVSFLEKADNLGYETGRIPLAASYNLLARRQWQLYNDETALDLLHKAAAVRPDYPYTLYNAGVVQWYTGRQGKSRSKEKYYSAEGKNWQTYLKEFLNQYGRQTPAALKSTIRDIFRGDYRKRPELITPPEPGGNKP